MRISIFSHDNQRPRKPAQEVVKLFEARIYETSENGGQKMDYSLMNCRQQRRYDNQKVGLWFGQTDFV